jgi:hypothetical protein
MAFASKHLAAVAFLALCPLGACATAEAGGYGSVAAAQGYQGETAYGGGASVTPPRLTPFEAHDGLLSSPPNNARAGECYAKVVVPGQPIGQPPAQQRAVWVQTPPGPGQVSPTWCIYYLPGAPQPVAMTPERYGWIRVVCDKDATEEKIRHVQRRLHEWGDYDGAYDGHFDKTTAEGVARFQAQRHIEHGGYLSVKTVEDLDGAPPMPELTPAFDAGHPNPNAPTIHASPIYQAQNTQQAYPPTVPYASAAPCGQVACPSPPPIAYAPPQIIYRQSPPQVVVQKVIQPVYQTIYAQAPQMGCGQPACTPQPQPCGPVCGAPGGQGWGGQGWGGGYPQQGPAPYRALLSWPGKTTY